MERNEYRENVKKSIDDIFDQIEVLKTKSRITHRKRLKAGV